MAKIVLKLTIPSLRFPVVKVREIDKAGSRDYNLRSIRLEEVMRLFITGGAGFIGSNFIRQTLATHPGYEIINFDKLTYAGNLDNLRDVDGHANYAFIRGDICDRHALDAAIVGAHAVINFAAESHVDRSIERAADFILTNALGTQTLLDAARAAGVSRFVQISTDEVMGSCGGHDYFTEGSPLRPNSPYAASKAAAEHLVRAAHVTFGLDVVTTRASNNYGPYQFPEKLIPLMITNAIEGKDLPVYGDGLNVRDWLYVEDCCRAIDAVLHEGRSGEVYNIGSRAEKTNLEIVHTLLELLNQPRSVIKFVTDRLGHDRRYATDPAKIETELGWSPRESFESGIEKTVRWYQNNAEWVARTRSGEYLEYYERMYGKMKSEANGIEGLTSSCDLAPWALCGANSATKPPRHGAALSESAVTEIGAISDTDVSPLARNEAFWPDTRTAMITGAGGLLGRAMQTRLRDSGWRVLAFPRTELDITNQEHVRLAVEGAAPNVLINCAATADVDRCEIEPDWAYAINEKGPRFLARACREFGADMVQVSTDYVFDGSKEGFYTQEDEAKPLGVYGQAKLAGEFAVREEAERFYVVRTSWLFGKGGKNFGSRVIEYARTGVKLKGVIDQTSIPTYAPDLAARLEEIISLGAHGLYQVTSSGPATWFDFARRALDLAGLGDVEIEPVTRAQLNQRAPRPHNSAMRCLVSEQLGLEPMRHWREALVEFVADC